MRFDLHAHLGLDLDEWLRGERDWRSLFDLLELIPDGAHYPSAIFSDREIAERIAEDEELEEGSARKSTDRSPPLRGYTPLMAKIDDLIDVLMVIQATAAKADPRKAGKVPRPRTAIERVRDERDSKLLSQFVDSLFRR